MNNKEIDEKIDKALKLSYLLESKLGGIIPDIAEKNKTHLALRMSLIKESDRGATLIAISYLESHLEDALRTKLIGTKKHLDKCLSFNGPIGTFSAKIDIAYSIGIINKDIYDEVNKFRKIRNLFAHTYSEVNLESDLLSHLVKELKLSPRNDYKTCSNRQLFLSSIFYLLGWFQGMSNLGEKLIEDPALEKLICNLENIRKENIY